MDRRLYRSESIGFQGGHTCTSRNRKHSENESNDFFIDLIATCMVSEETRVDTLFLVPRTRARTTLPKLPSPTSLRTSNLFSRGCATPSTNPKEGGTGVISSGYNSQDFASDEDLRETRVKNNIGCVLDYVDLESIERMSFFRGGYFNERKRSVGDEQRSEERVIWRKGRTGRSKWSEEAAVAAAAEWGNSGSRSLES